MTDDLVTAVSSLSHDGEFNSLGRRTKEPPDLQTTLSRASQRNKSIRSRETRDMSEELNSRAQSERQGIVNESDMGVFRLFIRILCLFQAPCNVLRFYYRACQYSNRGEDIALCTAFSHLNLWKLQVLLVH